MKKISLPDYHVHTALCKHACGEPSDYVRRAIEIGLPELGFSDHCPWPAGFDPNYRMFPEEYGKYRKIVEDARKEFPQIPIRYGIELDWVPSGMDEVWENLRTEKFDYLISSVHYVEGFPFDNPDFVQEWKKDGVTEMVWNNYFDSLKKMILDGGFDIIGHFDLPKKFGHIPRNYDQILKSVLPELLDLAANKGVSIEINSAGLRKTAAEIYPSLEILKIARKCGVAICFGSDSHRPEEVGADFDKSLQLAKDAGYTESIRFRERQKIPFPLPELP